MTELPDGIAKANALFRSGKYQQALLVYERVASRLGWEELVKANIALCRKRLQFNSQEKLPEIVVTLTTISSRLCYLPKVIGSLLTQTLRPTRIDLNISREPYLLDEGIDPVDPILMDLKNNSLLNINWCLNTGPYRKIWSFIEAHFSQTEMQEMLFVTVDDDTVYPDFFLRQLYDTYLKHDCIIAFRGRHITLDGQEISPYANWTWGQTTPSLNNLPTGKDGIFYSTKFFTKDFLKIDDAQRLAPTADDLWIKWHCALNGVPSVVLNPEACTSDYKSFPVVNFDQSYRGNSLYARYNATGAQSKNDIAVQKLEEHFMACYGYNLATMLASEKSGSVT